MEEPYEWGIQENATMQPGDAIIYAGDTNLLLYEKEQRKFITRMNHYQTLTQSRQLIIQWGKVALLTRQIKQINVRNPIEPFNQIAPKKKEEY